MSPFCQRSAIVLTIALILAALAGCEPAEYGVSMEPDGAEVKRTVTCTRNASVEALAFLSSVYPEHHGRLAFWGTFTGDLPKDLGNSGTYTCFESHMGSLFLYMERFMGNNDIVGEVETVLKAADQVADLLVGWFEVELKDDPGFPRLKEFCDTKLRQDLRNMGTYWWLALAADKLAADSEEEILARMGQYLVERGYVRPEELPAIVSAADSDSPDWFLQRSRQIVSRGLGYESPEEAGDALFFLSSIERVLESLDRYAVTTPQYRALKDPARIEPDEARGVEQSPTVMVAGKILEPVMSASLILWGGTKVTVRLKVDGKVSLTNGIPDEKARELTWSRTMPDDFGPEGGYHGFPMFCYAFWSRANEDFQKKHLGAVVLSGGELENYCLWRKGLSEERTREWDEFVAGLSGGDGLVEKLQSFTFSDQPAGEQRETAKGIRALINALTPPAPEAREESPK